MESLRALYDGKGLELLVENVRLSMNFDGAFGSGPGAESHGAQGGSDLSTARLFSPVSFRAWLVLLSISIVEPDVSAQSGYASAHWPLRNAWT